MIRLYQPIIGRGIPINLLVNPFIRLNKLFICRMNPFNRRYEPMSGVDERFIALHQWLLLPVKRFNPQGKRMIPPVNWINTAGKRPSEAAKGLIRRFQGLILHFSHSLRDTGTL
ncbi:MAG: hypothetical protein Q8M07_02435 [Prosthecobacter sp.]|nr:hypothetical protein [Prosthecobacter sp.]